MPSSPMGPGHIPASGPPLLNQSQAIPPSLHMGLGQAPIPCQAALEPASTLHSMWPDSAWVLDWEHWLEPACV